MTVEALGAPRLKKGGAAPLQRLAWRLPWLRSTLLLIPPLGWFVLIYIASLALLLISRPLLFASIDPEVAAARGLPVRLLGLGFMVLVGVVVAEAVQAVGALLILALMVTPAATAHRLSTRPYRALALSAALGLVVLWAGLTLSYAFQRVPPSFLVVALAFAIYLVVTAVLRLWALSTARRARPGVAAASV